jgi:hypothetical protein
MKLIQRLTLLSSIALLAGACDLQQTFDERIDDKQLLVLTPDFAETSVQLVFRDPETLAVLDEDFEVTVYSNKRLVDLNGNYKNEFIARGGVMEFSVSPEETVSESDPLQIGVVGTSSDNSKAVMFKELTYRTKGIHTSLIIPTKVPSEDELSDGSSSALTLNKSKPGDALSGSAEDIALRLEFQGQDIPISRFKYISGVSIRNYGNFNTDERDEALIYAAELSTAYALGTRDISEKTRLSDNLTISVKGVGRELINYNLVIWLFDDSKDRIEYTIDPDGNYERNVFISNEKGKYEWSPNTNLGRFSNYMDEVTVPKNQYFGLAGLEYWKRTDYKACSTGFNLSFDGAPSDGELNLLYKATRYRRQIFTIASFNVNSASNQYNSLQDGGSNKHVISVKGNTLEFAENSQYFIEPSVIDLGGEELCGKTFNVKLIPRDALKKHQLNISMRNENQNVGLALSFSALIRKQGQDDSRWESVYFKQGSTTLNLIEGASYEVKLTLADEPFEFTFTNDLSLVEAAVQATKRNVTRIKDINYRIEQSADINTINAEIVFYEGQSLID